MSIAPLPAMGGAKEVGVYGRGQFFEDLTVPPVVKPDEHIEEQAGAFPVGSVTQAGPPRAKSGLFHEQ